jgi:hypothetical protein
MPGALIVHHHARHKTYPGEVTGFVFFACLIASVGGCIFGYDIGLTGEDGCSLSLSLLSQKQLALMMDASLPVLRS